MENAIELFTKEGLKLGNYHYDVDYHENEEGKVEVYLTRYYEECKDCPLFNGECGGDKPPIDMENYPCYNALPVGNYCNGYDFVDGYEEVDNIEEFTDLEKEAVKMIWTNPEVFERLYEWRHE